MRVRAVVVVVLVAGCGGGHGTTRADAGGSVDASIPSIDGAVPVVDAGPTTDASTSVRANISLTGQPVALALDPTHDRLFAGVASSLTNLGIAVIDTSTDTLVTTVAPPAPSSGTLFPFNLLALDPTANILYAAPLFATTVYPFDATNGKFVTSFDVTGAALTEGCVGIIDLAVDPASSRLYVSCQGDAGDVEIVVFDTTNDTALKSIVLSDLASAFGHLALDTTNHLLFVSNAQQVASTILVDTIDTTTDTETGTQQPLPSGSLVGMQGGPGWAVLTTSNTFYSLEPAEIALPQGFVPDSFSEIGTIPPSFYVFGHDGATNDAEYVIVGVPGVEGDPLTLGDVKELTEAFGNPISITHAYSENRTDVYITAVDHPVGGGSTPENSIYHLHIY